VTLNTHEVINVDLAWADVCDGITRGRCNHCRSAIDWSWLTASSLHEVAPSELAVQLDRAIAALAKFVADAGSTPSEQHLLRRSEVASLTIKHEQSQLQASWRAPSVWVALPGPDGAERWRVYPVCEHAACMHVLDRPVTEVPVHLVQRAAGTLLRPLQAILTMRQCGLGDSHNELVPQVERAVELLQRHKTNPEVLWHIDGSLLERAQASTHGLVPVQSPASPKPLWLCQEHALLFAVPSVDIVYRNSDSDVTMLLA